MRYSSSTHMATVGVKGLNEAFMQQTAYGTLYLCALQFFLNLNEILYESEVGQSILHVVIDHQWLQFDVGPPKMVVGIATKGRGDRRHWVTRYRLSYSNDSLHWHFYSDTDHQNAVTVTFSRIVCNYKLM